MNDSVIHRPALIGPDDQELPVTQPLDVTEVVHAQRPAEAPEERRRPSSA
ncbi:hypothetical protein [Mycetocola zhujimingii]|nr:hypothetical protein [Mycetocola zhujimingii]